jgi:predicted alternative tryptophan synthase beta-subunit
LIIQRLSAAKTQANVFLKCENLQHTGSFKVRGAINKLLSLTSSQRELGVVTASSGNHGAAVAFGLNKLNMEGIIFTCIPAFLHSCIPAFLHSCNPAILQSSSRIQVITPTVFVSAASGGDIFEMHNCHVPYYLFK